jgi:hypothetical protein
MPTDREVAAQVKVAVARLIQEGIQSPNDEIHAQLVRLDRKGDKAGIQRLLDRVEDLPCTDQINIAWRLSLSHHVFYAQISRSPDDRIYDQSDEDSAVEPLTSLKLEINYRTQLIQVVSTGAEACGERDLHVAAVLLEELGVTKELILKTLFRVTHIIMAQHDWIPDPDSTWKALPVSVVKKGYHADDEAILRWLKLRLRVFAVVKNSR